MSSSSDVGSIVRQYVLVDERAHETWMPPSTAAKRRTTHHAISDMQLAVLPSTPHVPAPRPDQQRQDGSGAPRTHDGHVRAAIDLLGLLVAANGRKGAPVPTETVVAQHPAGQHPAGDAVTHGARPPGRPTHDGRSAAVATELTGTRALERRVVVATVAVDGSGERWQPASALRSVQETVGTVAWPTLPPVPTASAAVHLARGADGGAS